MSNRCFVYFICFFAALQNKYSGRSSWSPQLSKILIHFNVQSYLDKCCFILYLGFRFKIGVPMKVNLKFNVSLNDVFSSIILWDWHQLPIVIPIQTIPDHILVTSEQVTVTHGTYCYAGQKEGLLRPDRCNGDIFGGTHCWNLSSEDETSPAEVGNEWIYTFQT